MHAIGGGVCAICGERLFSSYAVAGAAGEARCGLCRRIEPPFARAAAYGSYETGLRELIHLLKYGGVRPAANVLGRMLAEAIATLEPELPADSVAVIPVPLHRTKLRQRGFNQAELIARQAAKRLRLPLKPVLLKRTKARPDKHILSNEERWRIVRGAFATRPGSQVDNKRVLLVDDVMTTGATLDACAAALLEAGAKSVVGLTVARVVRRETPNGIGE